MIARLTGGPHDGQTLEFANTPVAIITVEMLPLSIMYTDQPHAHERLHFYERVVGAPGLYRWRYALENSR